MTFGAKINVDIIVGNAIIAYIPSIKLMTIPNETVAPRIVDKI